MERRTLLSTYVVNTTADTPVSGLLDLRQAIAAANSHAGADTVTFSSSVFTTGSLHTITLLGGQISFTDTTGATTVTGPGTSVLEVDGNHNGRVFNTAAGITVNLSGMTIAKGLVQPSGTVGLGGGIANAGTLTITNSTISDNTAIGSDDSAGHDGLGGGIYSSGKLTITGSTIHGNTAEGGNGVSTSAINGDAIGGGIYTVGATTITTSTISNNTATISNGADSTVGGNAQAGGIFAGGGLTLSGVVVSGNMAQGFDRLTLGYTPGVAGNAQGGGIEAGPKLSITASTISGNTAQGGIAYYSDAGDAHGGGIQADGTLTLVTSTVAGNFAQGGSGEVPGSAFGGGINAIVGAATISSSTIGGNVANGGAGDNVDGLSPGPQGGAATAGAIDASTKLTLIDSTISGNSANGGAGGPGEDDTGSFHQAGGNGGTAIAGAIQTVGGLLFSNSTISNNHVTGGIGAAGGAGYPNGLHGTATASALDIFSGTSVANNTIISGNTGAADIHGSLASTSSHNLIGGGGGLTTGVNGNHVGVTNPMLAALDLYGGPTKTMKPLPGSPAINAGSNAVIPAGLTLDQRGFPRVSGSAVDIGAVEYGTASIAGTVFNDINANGHKDAGEAGLSGMKLFLDLNQNGLPDSGEPVVSTNASGNFTFSNLPAGTYRIWEETPVGYRVDSPAAFFSDVAVASGAAKTGVLFADTQKVLISGTVFHDTNKNGVQNSGETGLGNWRVYIDANNNGKFDSGETSVLTSSSGAWQFTTLPAGTYRIRVVQQAGYTLTTPSLKYFLFTVGAGGIRNNNLFGEFK
jgi:hypothetical protein